MSLSVSLLVGAYLFLAVWKKTSTEIAPRLETMRSHGEELVLLDEAGAILLEKQVAEIGQRFAAYESAVDENGEQPVPEGEKSVLMLSNEINSTLQKHHIRVVEREQVSERPGGNAAAPGPRPAARAAAKGAEQKKEETLPYNTREIHYVLEGDYKDMFMFLVKQSHLKPPYHFKNIKITPAPDRAGMRMTFTVQIHFI